MTALALLVAVSALHHPPAINRPSQATGVTRGLLLNEKVELKVMAQLAGIQSTQQKILAQLLKHKQGDEQDDASPSGPAVGHEHQGAQAPGTAEPAALPEPGTRSGDRQCMNQLIRKYGSATADGRVTTEPLWHSQLRALKLNPEDFLIDMPTSGGAAWTAPAESGPVCSKSLVLAQGWMPSTAMQMYGRNPDDRGRLK
jgi:hypothetical protein